MVAYLTERERYSHEDCVRIWRIWRAKEEGIVPSDEDLVWQMYDSEYEELPEDDEP